MKFQSIGSDSGLDLFNVMVDGNSVDLVESFTYLGRIQTFCGYCRPDFTRRIGLTSSAMSSRSNIWSANIFLSRPKYEFTKPWFFQSC